MSYYRIHDPIRGQKLLCDLIEYILYGRAYQGKQLNPFAEPFEMPTVKNLVTNKIVNGRDEKKTPQSQTSNEEITKSKQDKIQIQDVDDQWQKVQQKLKTKGIKIVTSTEGKIISTETNTTEATNRYDILSDDEIEDEVGDSEDESEDGNWISTEDKDRLEYDSNRYYDGMDSDSESNMGDDSTNTESEISSINSETTEEETSVSNDSDQISCHEE